MILIKQEKIAFMLVILYIREYLCVLTKSVYVCPGIRISIHITASSQPTSQPASGGLFQFGQASQPMSGFGTPNKPSTFNFGGGKNLVLFISNLLTIIKIHYLLD